MKKVTGHLFQTHCLKTTTRGGKDLNPLRQTVNFDLFLFQIVTNLSLTEQFNLKQRKSVLMDHQYRNRPHWDIWKGTSVALL